jgi:hypothetical protein
MNCRHGSLINTKAQGRQEFLFRARLIRDKLLRKHQNLCALGVFAVQKILDRAIVAEHFYCASQALCHISSLWRQWNRIAGVMMRRGLPKAENSLPDFWLVSTTFLLPIE